MKEILEHLLNNMDDYAEIIKNYNSITVVMTIKNRDTLRLEKCFQSLKDQTYPCKVILVDFGSEEVCKEEIRKVISNFSPMVTLVEVLRETKDFNKSRALNIGLRYAETKYILSTDIDIIFAPNFIEEIINVFKTKPKSIILSRKIDLDKDGNNNELHEPSASGSCIAIETDWINKVHGYDEYYTYWGREDNDLVDRAIQDGYEVIWITDRTKMWHQWHEPASQQTITENDWYYRKGGKSIIRNPNSWGEL